MPGQKKEPPMSALEKSPTGIGGIDEVTAGGLPKGRPTLICGPAGGGKTLFAMAFLVHGAVNCGEAGVFMTFEETAEELAQNVASLGFDLNELSVQGKLVFDYVYLDRSEIQEAGEYDLEGLFIRLAQAIDSIGAKRVVLDTIEALFAGLPDQRILRSELRRLFRWLKEKGVTTIVTGEQGVDTLTRHGLEEYIADCVIRLDHRVTDQIAMRRLRIVKYRGSSHGTNEYPFLIGKAGISVMPITSLELRHEAPTERVPTGVTDLDTMLEGKGYFRGSSVLISGTAGTGKTSFAAAFAAAACRRGERCLYLAFEESTGQIIRNLRSIGIDLEPWVCKDLLQFHGVRPTMQGLEMHLLTMLDIVGQFRPSAVVFDPITNLVSVGSGSDSTLMLMRLIDLLKSRLITTVFTSLTPPNGSPDDSDAGVSSVMDTWIVLRNLENESKRKRGLYILKSRGMAHSDRICEFALTKHRGIHVLDVETATAAV
jgi:circadian clock protein KaiC